MKYLGGIEFFFIEYINKIRRRKRYEQDIK